MRQLTDTDMMPFGKYGPHKGDPRTMDKVPASYFHWLWTNGLRDKTATDPVADYIQRNITSLMEEHPDGIWE